MQAHDNIHTSSIHNEDWKTRERTPTSGVDMWNIDRAWCKVVHILGYASVWQCTQDWVCGQVHGPDSPSCAVDRGLQMQKHAMAF